MRCLVLASALMLTACTTGPDISSDFDPSVNFAKYRTYSWIYTAPPEGMNPLTYERVHASIDRSLAARGYTQANPGDFAVAFTLGRRDKVQVTDFGPYGPYYPGWGWGYRWGGWAPAYRDVDVRNVTEGSLAIDFYDTTTKRPIWHGVATQEVTPGKVDQALIDTAVDATLAKFPPTTAPPR
ncbi:DUF4136 domain-containing protein [Sphingomonas sp. SM33]|uniref:DUF4136 domain-containing protein n=1 Tax=Sphingomonas telluris TaxID=2907998 RepID=A0ABS9VNG1_9SPHN|nr:DUF4136 domain-containing protein [Sphingomonas telluris]MCH8616508.1 DUF4136 domain-containing protein [Sphingomonas telluris]